MGKETKIAWTNHTLNFWQGCKKVSDGCKFCYMYRDKERYGQDPKTVVKTKDSTIKKVLQDAEYGDKIFVCSWSDFFIEEADQWREEAWQIIKNHPNFIFQIVTKRAERILKCLPSDWGVNGYPNVWLGVTCENQKAFEERYPYIEMFHSYGYDHSCKNFISFEPLLEKIDIPKVLNNIRLDWAIIGGESGNDSGNYRYRKCEKSWIYELITSLSFFDVPVFFKQFGTHLAKQLNLKDRAGADASEFDSYFQKFRNFPN